MQPQRTITTLVNLLLLILATMDFSQAQSQQVEAEHPRHVATSCFGDVAAQQQSNVDLNAMTISFYRGGVVKEVAGTDEFGRRQGWSVVYAPNSFPNGRTLLAAQQFRDGIPHGVHFFWEGIGGRNVPYSFGVWDNGKPLRGVFLPGEKGPVSLDQGGYRVGDAPFNVEARTADGRTKVVKSHEIEGLSQIKDDERILNAFKDLRAVAQYCSDLEVRKPPQKNP